MVGGSAFVNGHPGLTGPPYIVRFITVLGGAKMADVTWDALAPRLAALVERLDHIENYLTELGQVTGHPYGRYSSGVSVAVMELAMAGKTIQAIKQYREETGATLDEARAAVARVTAGGV